MPVSSPMPTTSFSSRKKPQHHAPSSFSFQDEAEKSLFDTSHEKGGGRTYFDAETQHTSKDVTMLSAPSPQVS